MMPLHNSLVALADRARWGDSRDRATFSQELESRLVPLIRVAMRTGSGLPALVSWVRERVAELINAGERPDPSQAAPRFARLLCSGLIDGLPARPGQETLRGR
jgi:hypothetical protein